MYLEEYLMEEFTWEKFSNMLGKEENGSDGLRLVDQDIIATIKVFAALAGNQRENFAEAMSKFGLMPLPNPDKSSNKNLLSYVMQ